MGSKWIEVGEALIQRDLIIAVSEVRYSKYDENWSYEVHINDGSMRGTSIHIEGKTEEPPRASHTALKQVLVARN